MLFATSLAGTAQSFPTSSGVQVIKLERSGLPLWCEPYLAGEAGDALAGRAWYDATLAYALPDGAVPILLSCGNGAVLLPLLQARDGGLRSLTTCYSLSWRPLLMPGTDEAALRRAGRDFGIHLRGGRPALLEALSEAAVPESFLAGVRATGVRLLRFAHFGNWHEPVQRKRGWNGYLQSRLPVLRNTIRRKSARCARDLRFELVDAPGPALDAGIADYAAARALSWKDAEPFPDFDGALMRGLAELGALRLGLLRRNGDCVAAQYWAVSGGRATVLKLVHDEASRDASPGTVLTAMMLERILGEDTVSEVDFGRGDDAYKRLWAGQRRQRTGVVLAHPRHPAGLAAITRHIAGKVLRTVRGRGTAA